MLDDVIQVRIKLCVMEIHKNIPTSPPCWCLVDNVLFVGAISSPRIGNMRYYSLGIVKQNVVPLFDIDVKCRRWLGERRIMAEHVGLFRPFTLDSIWTVGVCRWKGSLFYNGT